MLRANEMDLVLRWRRQARLMEQASTCGGCPVGGTPTALRECAADLEALATGRPRIPTPAVPWELPHA